MNNEEMLVKEFSMRILKALGQEKLQELSPRQEHHLDVSLTKLLDKKPIAQISDEEIVGSYEVIVDHVSPLAYEVL